MKKLLLILSSVMIMTSCTENTRAKTFGGTAKIELPKGKKLVNITWKDDGQLWYLTRDMKTDEIAESYSFQENSKWGLIEGTVNIIENK